MQLGKSGRGGENSLGFILPRNVYQFHTGKPLDDLPNCKRKKFSPKMEKNNQNSSTEACYERRQTVKLSTIHFTKRSPLLSNAAAGAIDHWLIKIQMDNAVVGAPVSGTQQHPLGVGRITSEER